MMQRDVIGVSNALFEMLSERMEGCTLKFKTSASLDPADYAEAKPSVYLFTYPTSAIDEVPSPSVLIQVSRVTPETIHYVVYCDVVHAAIQECEYVDESPEGSHRYVYREGGDFTSDGVREELYRAALLLGDYVLQSIFRMGVDRLTVSNAVLLAPSAYMSEFPHCSSTIEFDVSYNSRPITTVGTRLRELL